MVWKANVGQGDAAWKFGSLLVPFSRHHVDFKGVHPTAIHSTPRLDTRVRAAPLCHFIDGVISGL